MVSKSMKKTINIAGRLPNTRFMYVSAMSVSSNVRSSHMIGPFQYSAQRRIRHDIESLLFDLFLSKTNTLLYIT